ncbi:hypothetical protein NRY95_12080 [Xanthomonas campestris pv. phormiicola]|nr:hypothetical protein [Xanthomonas campestris pv. phormiicola]UYC14492.1 hypothetical protein NRY95_12080 [Xanthomonas campestris pv. phormiicola]
MSDLPLSMPPAGAFFGLDLQALAPPQRDALRHADADFRAVAAGRVPLHARLDTEAPLPAKGGTRSPGAGLSVDRAAPPVLPRCADRDRLRPDPAVG